MSRSLGIITGAVLLLSCVALAVNPAVEVTTEYWMGGVLVGSTPPEIHIGQTMTLKVFGEVLPAANFANNGILGWGINVVMGNSSLLSYGTATVTGWEGEPGTSSSGTVGSGGLSAIYDTSFFDQDMGLAGPVQLFTLDITGYAEGSTSLTLQGYNAFAPGGFLLHQDGIGEDYRGGLYPSLVTIQVNPVFFGPGDYNSDFEVSQDDLDLVRLNWGSMTTPAGWTSNLPTGMIDQEELDSVLLNWGATTGEGMMMAAAPEPMSLGLLAVGSLALLRRRRHR